MEWPHVNFRHGCFYLLTRTRISHYAEAPQWSFALTKLVLRRYSNHYVQSSNRPRISQDQNPLKPVQRPGRANKPFQRQPWWPWTRDRDLYCFESSSRRIATGKYTLTSENFQQIPLILKSLIIRDKILSLELTQRYLLPMHWVHTL